MMTRIGLSSRGVETFKSHFRVKVILDIAKSVRRRKTELATKVDCFFIDLDVEFEKAEIA